MRRGLSLLICGAAVAVATSSVQAQYYPPASSYYPSAPAYYNPQPYVTPAQYATPYYGGYGYGGYAAPAYVQPRPMYYYPPPQQMMRPPGPPPQYAGTGFAPRTYGPLLDPNQPADPRVNPNNRPPANRPPNKVPAQTTSNTKLFKSVSKQDAPPEMTGSACGPNGCGPDGCGPNGCGPDGCGLEPFVASHQHPRGHFVGQIGALFLVPYVDSTTAFTTTTVDGAGVPTTLPNGFSQQVVYGERGSVGYIWHSGWGVRAGYTHVGGTTTAGSTNTNPAATIMTPLGITLSPSFSLTNAAVTGAGSVDSLGFSQKLDIHYVDVEILKECNWKSTTFLFGAGARWARFFQSYEASRTISGPVVTTNTNPASTSAVNASSSSKFEGVGPTASFEVVQPLTSWGLAMYGSVRGSWLWGTQKFSTANSTTSTMVDGNGDVTTTNAAVDNISYFSQVATVIDTEIGLQQGFKLGRSYVFGRAGAVYQRWWNVGSSTNSAGNVAFLGGTVMLGITY